MKHYSPIALALGLTLATPAFSADYYVVVPVPNRTPAVQISVSLADYTFPTLTVATPVSEFDFKSLLQVVGDQSYAGSGLSFAVSTGALPPGLELSATTGLLSGTPSSTGSSTFEVTASYKGVSAKKSYSMTVNALSVIVTNGVRTWSDNTYASSCLAYKTGDTAHQYTGATGDGVYRIQPPGQNAADVYCDMTSNGGGWTLVLHGNPNALPTDATWLTDAALSPETLTGLSGPTAKHAAAFIAAIPKSTYKVTGTAGSYGSVTRYLSGNCAFSLLSSVAPGSVCSKTYADAALTTGYNVKVDPKSYNSNARGMSDYNWTSDSPVSRTITVSFQGTSYWSLGLNAPNSFRSSNTAPIGGVSGTGAAEVWMYVR